MRDSPGQDPGESRMLARSACPRSSTPTAGDSSTDRPSTRYPRSTGPTVLPVTQVSVLPGQLAERPARRSARTTRSDIGWRNCRLTQAQRPPGRSCCELMTEESLRAKVASERWQIPYPGVVVMHSGPVSPAQQLWVDLLSLRPRGGARRRDRRDCRRADGRPSRSPSAPGAAPTSGDGSSDLDVHSSTRLGSADVHPLKRPRRTRRPRSLRGRSLLAARMPRHERSWPPASSNGSFARPTCC